jgi:plastocyanin
MKPLAVLLSLAVLSSAATFEVGMVNFAFSPQDQTVAPGDTVRWINQSISPHTSTSGTNGVPDSFWNSGTVSSGDTFTMVIILAPNTYPYYCAFHWSMGMTGTITVGVGIGEGESRKSRETRISAVRPNPFSRSVRIDYTVSEPGWTEITLFNNAGRRVKTLVRALHAAGTHSLTWEGQNDAGDPQPNGIYFIRLRNESGRVTQKLIRL